MNRKLKSFIILFFCLSCSFAQENQFEYKRTLNGIETLWHRIVLTDDVFGKVRSDLSNIRIYGVKENNDTVEAPYILTSLNDQKSTLEVPFKRINSSNTKNYYYFTFETNAETVVNEIVLHFEQQNFNWKIKLEGSFDQRDWFTIIDKYRILSIKNNFTDYHYSSLIFADSKYQFFRLGFESEEKPNLVSANILQNETTEGRFKAYDLEYFNISNEKDKKTTTIQFSLKETVPVSSVKFNVIDSIDYYRPFTLEYVTDSFHTQKGWKYNYVVLASGTLSSLENPEIKFNNTLLKKMRMIIQNFDNQPLNFGNPEIKGNLYELTARFTEKATYFLVYGNKMADAPLYDIENFKEKIPEQVSMLSLGAEEKIQVNQGEVINPFFENKAWLWVVMGIIILLLGWFSLKMIKSTSS